MNSTQRERFIRLLNMNFPKRNWVNGDNIEDQINGYLIQCVVTSGILDKVDHIPNITAEAASGYMKIILNEFIDYTESMTPKGLKVSAFGTYGRGTPSVFVIGTLCQSWLIHRAELIRPSEVPAD